MSDFVHLHIHSDYSILDGAITVDRLIKRTIELGMDAVALTDHGNMFGAVDFYQKAIKAGIKPIVGEEFYVAPDSRFRKEHSKDNIDDKSYHLILLAENEVGYKNLLRLSSVGYTEGFYYKPRIDMEILEQYSKGIICSSACLAGEIPRYILRNQIKEAYNLAGRFNEIFGQGRFYLELQDHGIPEQKIVNTELIKMSAALNIPLIATNDAHYLNRADAYAHEILLCVQTGKTIDDENRMRFACDEFYFKSEEEMRALFADCPEAITNTKRISEMIDLKIDLGHPSLPDFHVPEGFDLNSYLSHLAEEGAHRIYGESIPEKVRERIDYEFSVISKMNFAGYFLIVWDFIKEAKRMRIPTGPGRGSAAGSIISYCLGITALDPIRYDLLFERFLNPERNEMPDMDLDFCAERREEIIEYVRQKYGADKVSQIITFNKMLAKAVVKDVARVMAVPYARANEISKMIDRDKPLQDSIDNSKDLQAIVKAGGVEKELLDISLKLEGLVRSAGKHAAGVVISKGALTDFVPLYVESKENSVASQYEKDSLEKAGLVKMDFLGLKNLTVIDNCVKLIKESTGEDIDLEKLSLDDPAVFSLLHKADTIGIFQLESGGMQNLLRKISPSKIEDIIALVALYRPGPLNSGMADDFVERKRDPRLVKYAHPLLETVLEDTLGVIVYQEQVMLISQLIGGFTMPEADKLRKAMGKKQIDIMLAMKEKFISGAVAKNIDAVFAKELYEQIEKFGEYGFNKSHSAAYAIVTYQTAYLKSHYRIQYMTALLSTLPGKDDVPKYLNDCKKNGIKVLPPSINTSDYNFAIEKNKIRFGFQAIKGMGEKAAANIIEVREAGGKFTSLKDFFERIDSTAVNRGVLEALVKAGCFDELNTNRAGLLGSVELLRNSGRSLRSDKEVGQGNLFGGGEDGEESAELDLLDIPEWTESEMLEHEKDVLGFYVTGHPLARYEKEIKYYSSHSTNSLANHISSSGKVEIVGILQDFTIKFSKKDNKRYAIGRLEDLEGSLEILVFSGTLEKFYDILTSNEPLLVNGYVEFEVSDTGDDIPAKIKVQSVRPLRELRREAISALHITLDSIGFDTGVLSTVKSIFEKHIGDCPVYFHVSSPVVNDMSIEENEFDQIGSLKDKKTTIRVGKTFNIEPSENLIRELCGILGEDSVHCTIGYQ